MNKILIAILALVSAAIGVFVYQTQVAKQQPEHALLYQKARPLANFELTDHNGNSFTNEQLRGKWTLFFFGYTSCPDICPVTLQELNYIYPELKEITDNKIQVALVTADPKRDSQKKLNSYIRYFNEEFIALRGGHEVLYPFARNIGLMYAIVEDSTEENYLVNHSASIVLTNPNGQIHAIFKPTQVKPTDIPTINSEIMLSDFDKIYQISEAN
ncbi:SCO family protein [Thalassomonas sp. M1454]|uniref:SCO family protein n=1 Tax=Thalassomonas sp. M1454 TaxID=2594477 RepID=UPI0011813698|nr:SCO family protein [Thalassomonas sp. M1454]TRX55137.1 SCO family protein [Thalassomonas sp. M1454]